MTGIGAMNETEFKTWVMDLARLRRWLIHHDRPGRTKSGWVTALEGHSGFPDLVLARKGRLIIAELKTERGKLEPEQDAWLTALTGQGATPHAWAMGVPLDGDDGPNGPNVTVHLWRPSHRGIIEDLLA